MEAHTLAAATRRPRFRRAPEPPAFRVTDDANDRLARLFHAGYLDRPHAQLDRFLAIPIQLKILNHPGARQLPAEIPHPTEPVIVENVTGGGGTVGVGRVAHAAPDGYTLVLGNNGTHVVAGVYYALRYDLLNVANPLRPLSLRDAPPPVRGRDTELLLAKQPHAK